MNNRARSIGLTAALRSILEDGKWHASTELYARVHRMIPVHSALRAAGRDMAIREGRNRTVVPNQSRDIQMARGIALILLEALRKMNLETRGKRGMQREWRMPLKAEQTEQQLE